jgi:hypothetical protein
MARTVMWLQEMEKGSMLGILKEIIKLHLPVVSFPRVLLVLVLGAKD